MVFRSVFERDMAILRVCCSPKLITHVMYKVNVNSNDLKSRIRVLVTKGFLLELEKSGQRRWFVVSDSGKEMLNLYFKAQIFYKCPRKLLSLKVS